MLQHLDNRTKILVVEDNSSIIEGLQYILEKEGFETYIVTTKQQAIENINRKNYELFLLDIELPDGTGFDICKKVKSNSNKPIIFVSGKIEESNIVYGLDIGADDYITKPFRNSELVSRIKSVLRRYPSENNEKVIYYSNIKVDLDKAKVYINQEEVFLTKLEYKILLLFLNNRNRIVTREEILEKVWDVDGNYVNDNTLSVYIKRLRNKISDGKRKDKQMIETIRGIGYMLHTISD